MTTTTFLG
jgi:hypothetical protein